jgi:hypothetical protein
MLSRRHRWIPLALPFTLALLAAPAVQAGPALPAGIHDNFGGSSLDPGRWTTDIHDPNITISEGGGVLAARVGGSTPDGALAFIWTRCSVHGDFDARVTYSLPVWPFGDDAAFSLNANDLGPYGLGRHSKPQYDEYFSYLPPVVTELLTNDLTGTLRLTRRGSRVTALIKQGQTWRQLDTKRDAPTSDTRIDFLVNQNPTFGHQSWEVDFDSFSVRAQRIDC